VREELGAELAFSPTTATWLGDHHYDDHLDEVQLDAAAREAARLRAMVERVHALRDDELDGAHRVDRALLERRCESALYDLTELRPLERNPIVYISIATGGIEELLAAETLPLADRVRLINARLWKVRRLFDDARRNLRGTSPELYVRKAIELGQAAQGFVVETLPKALQSVGDAKLFDELKLASGDAARALDDFVGWLQRDLLLRAHGDFALGRERLLEKLRLVDGVTLSPEQLVALGERELRDARKRYDDAARFVVAGHAGADVAKLIEDDHAKPDELLVQVHNSVDLLAGFVGDHHFLTLPTPPAPRVMEMPPAFWGFVRLGVGGPLEARPREPVLLVDPVDKRWEDRRKQEHLRAFNRPVMLLAVAHEVCGHYVVGERDRHAPTTMQKLALAPTFVEGWAHYVERALLDEGWGGGDARLRLVVERATMLRAARLVAVVRLHALGAKIDDVAKGVFTDEAYLDEYQARREAERAAEDPLVLADTLGRLELERLRDDWRAAHDEASLGAFHDALLAHGSPPPSVLRRVLLPGDRRDPL
jgi:uncharacterized protein (DUF885 family)